MKFLLFVLTSTHFVDYGDYVVTLETMTHVQSNKVNRDSRRYKLANVYIQLETLYCSMRMTQNNLQSDDVNASCV
jgi:uncharacterized membrane protein YukC